MPGTQGRTSQQTGTSEPKARPALSVFTRKEEHVRTWKTDKGTNLKSLKVSECGAQEQTPMVLTNVNMISCVYRLYMSTRFHVHIEVGT